MSVKVAFRGLKFDSRAYKDHEHEWVLTKEQEYAHIRSYLADENTESRDALIMTCIPFIKVKVSKNFKQYINSHCDYEDLVQVGILEAFTALKYLKGFNFKGRLVSYISSSIHTRIWHYLLSRSKKGSKTLNNVEIIPMADSEFINDCRSSEQEAIRWEELEHMEQAYWNSISDADRSRISRLLNGDSKETIRKDEGVMHLTIARSIKRLPQIL